MATLRWVGGAQNTAQVSRSAFGGTWLVGETVTVTVGSKSSVFTTLATAISAVIGDVVAGLQALSPTDYPEFGEIIWSSDGTRLVGTSRTAGLPINFSLATNSGSGTVAATAVFVANAGPSSWATAANWSTGAVPVSTNDVIVDDPTYPILYDMVQTAVTLNSLTVKASYTADGGLPLINQTGTPYPEYRGQYLQIGATTVTIGDGPGDGTSRFKLDTGSVACALYVNLTGSSPDGLTAVMWKGTSASNKVSVRAGSEVGIAIVGGETANVSGGLLLGPGASVRCGLGVTIATVTNQGGSLETNSAIGTSLTQQGGATLLAGTGAIAQITVTQGGAVIYNTSGTLGGNTTLDNGSTLDFSRDQKPKTVTNPIVARGGSVVNDSLKVVASLVVSSPDGTGGVAWGTSWVLTRT